ncbi:MAG: phosphoribosylpyrophosphate synthetase [Bacteroidota bacterium]
MRDYDNLVEAINGLKAEGYTLDFNLQTNCLYCKSLDRSFEPPEFEVEELLHFESDDSSADGRSMIYVIKTQAGNGILLTTNSMYAQDLSPALKAALTLK